MRINFSYSTPTTIREGITRLGPTLKELLHDTYCDGNKGSMDDRRKKGVDKIGSSAAA